jgi:ketosteroid isomerase-like protein
MQGRERLREYFGDRAEVVRSRRSTYRDVVLHHSTDPEVVIAEYARDIVTVGTGETTTLVCVAVMRVRGGKIAHFRDYFQAVA